MNAHQLDAQGVIINTIVVDRIDVFPGLVDASIGGKRGDRIVGGVLVPTAPVVVVPQEIPMINAHLMLAEADWMDGVEAYIAGLPKKERQKANAYLHKSPTMRRQHPLVLAIPAAMNKTEAQVDALFIEAAALQV